MCRGGGGGGGGVNANNTFQVSFCVVNPSEQAHRHVCTLDEHVLMHTHTHTHTHTHAEDNLRT